ncbi:9872_t:CDS:2 [Gigaspora margarita]|uniref:9872_t:CDS:1 n=1 Tax=Gigaspora margarita TaxID=4874 RepID=A0ABN7VYR4_GIGMA|nr:9872_t:CDS:2 [Gigaspora margarita]
MQTEIDSLRQRFTELEARNAELIKRMMEENNRHDARILKLEQDQAEREARIIKLEQDQAEREAKKNRKFQTRCIQIAKEILNEEPIIEYRPPFLNGLELDAFFQKYRIGLEVQGAQHRFHSTSWYKDVKKLEDIVNCDRQKRCICLDNGIFLIEVWYDQNPEIVIPERIRKIREFVNQASKIARIFRPALRTLQPKTSSLTLQKRSRQAKPTYDLPESSRIFPKFASAFEQEHLDALQVSFEPADKYEVIPPDIKVTIPEKYLLPKVNHNMLKDQYFNVENLEIEDDCVKTFVDKLRDVINNSGLDTGTSESVTDTLVNDLLVRVVNLDDWPFKVRLQPPLDLITTNGSVSAEPEFVVNKKNIALIGVDDKHLKNKKIYPLNGYGECQIGAEILACGYENMIEDNIDQEIFAFRVISTYVTFYRAEIPASYWKEFVVRLPKKQSVVIKRWPKENNSKRSGLNLAEPDGRKAVITDLIKIRQLILNKS